MARHHRGPAQVALAGDRPCVLCPEAAARDTHLCTGHRDDIGHMLDPTWDGDPAHRIPASIPVYWSQLDPAPGRGGDNSRRAPGFRSTPPLSLDAVVMRDPRSRPNAVVPVWFTRLPNGKDDIDRPHHEPDGQPRPVEVALANVCHELWTQWGHHGPELGNGDIAAGGVDGLAGWLHHHRARICSHTDVAQIHGFLADLLHHLRAACGDRDEQPVGRCTGWIPQPRGERIPCGAWIYPPVPTRDGPQNDPEDVVVSCPRCPAEYGKVARARLALAHRDGDREAVSA